MPAQDATPLAASITASAFGAAFGGLVGGATGAKLGAALGAALGFMDGITDGPGVCMLGIRCCGALTGVVHGCGLALLLCTWWVGHRYKWHQCVEVLASCVRRAGLIL